MLPLLLYLGFWQLDRAEQKSVALQHMLQRSKEAPALTLEAKMDVNKLLWRKVILSGVFAQTPAFLLDNQVVDGRAGYFVYSPFELDSNNTVLVNRGWIRATADRGEVPVLEVRHGRVEISGLIKVPPATGILLAENTEEKLAEGLYRLQHINLLEINERYNLNLLPYVIRLEPESTAGYVRKWNLPGSGKEKHLGYAFQWFAMAGALLIIFLTVNLKKRTDGDSKT